jgi:myo-inositol-1(or 4)-monophosphatase
MNTWTDDRLLALLTNTADAVVDALAGHTDWSLVDRDRGQYVADLVADAAALGVLDAAGVGVVSEESGRRRSDHSVTVVVDPLDGSTNASRGVPWYATSLAAVVDGDLRVAVVANLATSRRYEAVDGHGATRDGRPVVPSSVTTPGAAMVGLSGYPPSYLGWRQYRAMGAVALDLCAVADGTLDGYMDCSWNAHGVWDYLGAMLVCSEAGAVVTEASGRELVTLDPADRRTPVAGATAELAAALLERRQSFTTPGAADEAAGAPSDH